MTAEIHPISGRIFPHAAENAGEGVPPPSTSPATIYPNSRPKRHQPPAYITAYGLFRIGYDTAQIALRLGLPEPVVHKRITLARDTENGTQTLFERLDP